MTGNSDAESRTQERYELLRSSALFADLSSERLDEVLSRCQTRRVPAGDYCVREGDPSDGLYLVVYGRLQTFLGEELGDQISQGQVFGEIGMITGDRRGADVRAVRDTEVLFLPAEEFERLALEHPRWLRRVAQVVVDRVVARHKRPVEERVLTIGVVPVGEVDSLAEVSRAFAATLGEDGKVVVADEPGAPPPQERARWAQSMEDSHRYVIYQANSSPDSEWTLWCTRHSDRVVLVADAACTPVELPTLAREVTERIRAGTLYLALLQPPLNARPMVARGYRSLVGESLVINVRRGNERDLARMSRLIAGRAVGLVLGGGGPRGFVHLGVMRALEESGVPVDAIGGTSIGAVMGSFRSLDLDAATCERWALDGLVESGNLFPPTLPVLSYSSARKVRQLLESETYLGTRLIEETWIPFFCVSANLTRAEVIVHTSGPLANAVRASLSLPGIFPPVRLGSDFLVDGGVLNNLPVDIMRRRFLAGSVVAVDLSVDEEVGAPPSYEETPSGWSLLLSRLGRRQRGVAPPLSLSVLMRARELAGIRAQREILAECPPDLLIRPDLSRTSMFDFKGARGLIEVGYRAAAAALASGDWPTGQATEDRDTPIV